MSAQYDSPQFWRSLYTRPEDSNTEVDATGSHVVFEDGDLVANIEGAFGEEEMDLGGAIDADQLETLVDRLVARRIAEGGFVADPGGAPPAGSAPRAAPAPKPAAKAAPSPPPPSPTTRAPAASSPAAPPPPAARPPSAPAAAAAPPAAKPPAAAPPAAANPSPPPAQPGDPWARIPYLPGGQASIIGVDGLDAMAPMVLVVMDGSTTLRQLQTLVPAVPEDQFVAIVRDGLKRGLVAFK